MGVRWRIPFCWSPLCGVPAGIHRIPVPYGYNLEDDMAILSPNPSHLCGTNPFLVDGENEVQCSTTFANIVTFYTITMSVT